MGQSEQSTEKQGSRRSVRRMVWLVSGYLLVLLLAQRVGAEDYWPTLLLTYMPQVLPLTPAAVLVLWVGWRGRWVARVWAAAVVLFALFAFGDLQLPLPVQRPVGQPVRVLTCNTHYGRGGVARIAALIDRWQPDVVCLQEVCAFRETPDPGPEFRRQLAGWHIAAAGEQMTLTRRPQRWTTTHVVPGHHAYHVLEVGLDLGGTPLTIFNTHVETAAGPEMIDDGWAKMPRFIHGMNAVRATHAQVIDAALDAARGPKILCGDFNTPPLGHYYAYFQRRLTDAFTQSGCGLGYTFRADFPVLRIDYVWLDERVTATRCTPLPDAGSDHLPLLAELVVTRP